MPYSLKYLQEKPTLATGLVSDLKVVLPRRRVWLSRATPERPEQVVTVEKLVAPGRWQAFEEYPAVAAQEESYDQEGENSSEASTDQD